METHCCTVFQLQERNKKYRGVVRACPSPVDTVTDVTVVSCGSRHTVVLLGELYNFLSFFLSVCMIIS